MPSEEPQSEVEQTHPNISEMDPRTVLLARIELLESETKKLKEAPKRKHHFHIEDIQKMVSFYTGFVSFRVFSAFFEFLGQLLITLITEDPRRELIYSGDDLLSLILRTNFFLYWSS